MARELVVEHDVLKVLEKLPPMVFIGPTAAKLLGASSAILIRRGGTGYELVPGVSDKVAAHWNRVGPNPTPEQIEAMKYGALHGWDCTGADPENYFTLIPHVD